MKESPFIVLDLLKGLLDVDTIEGNKATAEKSKDSSGPCESHFAERAHQEPDKYDGA